MSGVASLGCKSHEGLRRIEQDAVDATATVEVSAVQLSFHRAAVFARTRENHVKSRFRPVIYVNETLTTSTKFYSPELTLRPSGAPCLVLLRLAVIPVPKTVGG